MVEEWRRCCPVVHASAVLSLFVCFSIVFVLVVVLSTAYSL
jgi:hypothetical protein